jgi:circadian clock protein KaiB
MKRYKLKLYVVGRTSKSEKAVKDFQELVERELPDQYILEVIDVLERPDLAEGDRILATPTVLKELPLPIRKIVGDLSDREKILLGLDLKPEE